MMIVSWRGPDGKFPTIFETNSAKQRLWIEQAVKDYSVENGSSYIICTSESNAGYAYYLCKYLLCSTDITTRVVSEPSQLEDTEGYKYMFLYDSENEIIQEWVKENYPEQEGNRVIILTNE